jgi:hypothetical protein
MKIESTVSWRETGMNFNEYQVLAEQTAIYDNEFLPCSIADGRGGRVS